MTLPGRSVTRNRLHRERVQGNDGLTRFNTPKPWFRRRPDSRPEFGHGQFLLPTSESFSPRVEIRKLESVTEQTISYLSGLKTSEHSFELKGICKYL